MLPSSFKLMAHTVKVKRKKNLKAEDGTDCDGLWSSHEKIIWVDSSLKGAMLWHTFYHELMHAVLDLLSYEKLNGNEQFVDQIGGLLAQYELTKRT